MTNNDNIMHKQGHLSKFYTALNNKIKVNFFHSFQCFSHVLFFLSQPRIFHFKLIQLRHLIQFFFLYVISILSAPLNILLVFLVLDFILPNSCLTSSMLDLMSLVLLPPDDSIVKVRILLRRNCFHVDWLRIPRWILWIIFQKIGVQDELIGDKLLRVEAKITGVIAV